MLCIFCHFCSAKNLTTSQRTRSGNTTATAAAVQQRWRRHSWRRRRLFGAFARSEGRIMLCARTRHYAATTTGVCTTACTSTKVLNVPESDAPVCDFFYFLLYFYPSFSQSPPPFVWSSFSYPLNHEFVFFVPFLFLFSYQFNISYLF